LLRLLTAGFGPFRPFAATPKNVRYRGDCVAKLDDKPLARNNRIVAHKFLNQHCALASALESMLLVLAPKIVLQHNRRETGLASDRIQTSKMTSTDLRDRRMVAVDAGPARSPNWLAAGVLLQTLLPSILQRTRSRMLAINLRLSGHRFELATDNPCHSPIAISTWLPRPSIAQRGQ
jgi:hypothetical protein